MPPRLEARHDLTPDEVDAIEDRLYEHNSQATGRHDGRDSGFVTGAAYGRGETSA